MVHKSGQFAEQPAFATLAAWRKEPLPRPPPLASRLELLKPSATASFHQRVVDLRTQGVDVLGFGVGEPDFDTPSHILEAAQRALFSGATRYTSVRGIAPLRRAIARDSAARRGGITHDEA